MKIRRYLPLLRWAISAALLVWLYRRIDPGQVRAVFLGARLPLLALLFLMLFANTAISAWKWRLFLHADGIRIPFRKLLGSYLVGSFFNMFLPSNIGGDAYRIYDVAQYSRRAAHSAASVLADRLSGFVALSILGLAFGLAGLRLLPDRGVLLIPLAVMILLLAAVGALLQQRLARWCLARPPFSRLGRLAGFASQLLDSVAEYRRAPGLFLRIMALSFLFQCNAICCIFVLARALDLALPFIAFCVFVPLISLLEALPVSIYGLGIRDASYVFFFGAIGLPRVECLTLALAYVLVTLIYCLSGGLIFMLRPKTPTVST